MLASYIIRSVLSECANVGVKKIYIYIVVLEMFAIQGTYVGGADVNGL